MNTFGEKPKREYYYSGATAFPERQIYQLRVRRLNSAISTAPKQKQPRITYVLRPLLTLTDPPVKDSDFEFFIFGGANEDNLVNYELRRRFLREKIQP